jgi:hypothetical protein
MAGAGIESLVSAQLNAVSFVMDYVEFHFNGRCHGFNLLADERWQAPPGPRRLRAPLR